MSNDIRIRLIRLPSARDLEYFALKYLRLNGIYEVPLELAKDLIEFDYAMPTDGSEPLTSLGDARNLEEDID
jgi:hypothetical protein